MVIRYIVELVAGDVVGLVGVVDKVREVLAVTVKLLV